MVMPLADISMGEKNPSETKTKVKQKPQSKKVPDIGGGG